MDSFLCSNFARLPERRRSHCHLVHTPWPSFLSLSQFHSFNNIYLSHSHFCDFLKPHTSFTDFYWSYSLDLNTGSSSSGDRFHFTVLHWILSKKIAKKCACVWMSECVCMASVYISYIGKVNIIKERRKEMLLWQEAYYKLKYNLNGWKWYMLS